MPSLNSKYPYLLNAEFCCRPSNQEGRSLHATLVFGEGDLTILGRIRRFAIRTAFLAFKPTACELPTSGWVYGDFSPLTQDIELEITEANIRKEDTQLSLGLSLKSPASAGRQRGTERRAQTTRKQKSTRQTIWTQGSSHNLRMRIQAPPPDNFLAGKLLDDALVLHVIPQSDNPTVAVYVVIPADGIVLLDSNLRAKSPNKFGLTALMLRREIAERGVHLCDVSAI